MRRGLGWKGGVVEYNAPGGGAAYYSKVNQTSL